MPIMLKDILNRIEMRLEATNQTAAGASARAKLSKDAIRNIQRAVENGKEGGASTQTILKLAPILGTSASWLLEGVGPEDFSNVPVMGYVGAGAEVEPDFEQIPSDGLEQLHIPFALPDEMIAFEIRGDSMLPRYDDGAVLIVHREQKRANEWFYGRYAVVRTEEGRRFVKQVLRGDPFTLVSLNAPPIEGIVPVWIGEIFAVLPRESLSKG